MPDAKKFTAQWHVQHGLRNCTDEPQEYSLSGILYSIKQRPENGCDQGLDMGAGAPARHKAFWSLSRCNIFKRIRLAWQVLKGEASILYYR